MIRDSLGLVAAALSTQTDWKLSLTRTGTWVLKKRPRSPSEAEVDPTTVTMETQVPEWDAQGDSLYLFV